MTEDQQEQLVRFLALFTYLLREGSAKREQAEIVLQAAASCVIGGIFEIGMDSTEHEAIADFVRRTIAVALRLQYEPHTVKRVPLQA